MAQRTLRDRECIVCSHTVPRESVAAEANGSGALVVGKRVAANKGANSEGSGCAIAGEQLRSGERKKEGGYSGSE